MLGAVMVFWPVAVGMMGVKGVWASLASSVGSRGAEQVPKAWV